MNLKHPSDSTGEVVQSAMDPVSIARARVHEFEDEMEEKLRKLPEIEEQVKHIGEARRRWLSSVSLVDTIETDVFMRKLEVLKKKAELYQVKIKLDSAKLQRLYELQTLRYLVAATKPYDEDDDDDKSREVYLGNLTNENLEELRTALQKSINLRSAIASQCYELTSDVNRFQVDYESHRKILDEEVTERIKTYITRLEESVAISRRNHKKVTSDYLVLRHNARVARDILLTGKQEAAASRKALQERVDKLVEEAMMQRDRMEKASAAELKLLTNDIRNDVIQKEQELEKCSEVVEMMKIQRSRACKDIKREIRLNVKKFNDLQEKRRIDLKTIGEEMKYLRELISQMELQLMIQYQTQFMNAEERTDAENRVLNTFVMLTKQVKGKKGSKIRKPLHILSNSK